jgi:hypothetical protein
VGDPQGVPVAAARDLSRSWNEWLWQPGQLTEVTVARFGMPTSWYQELERTLPPLSRLVGVNPQLRCTNWGRADRVQTAANSGYTRVTTQDTTDTYTAPDPLRLMRHHARSWWTTQRTQSRGGQHGYACVSKN